MNHFWRYLLLAVVLFFGALAFIVFRNWDTVSLAWENATALQEGSEEARQISTPEDLSAYLGRHPNLVSIAVVDPDGAVRDSVAAEAPRPLQRLPQVLLLAGAARRMADGRLDPEARVPLREIDRYALPGLTDAAHSHMVDSLTGSGKIVPDGAGEPTISVRDAAASIHTFQNTAAADWLIHKMGRDAVATLPAQFNMNASAAPRPLAATYVTWMRHARSGVPVAGDADGQQVSSRAPAPYLGYGRDAYVDSVFANADRLAQDDAFRDRLNEFLSGQGTELSVRRQREYAMATFPRGTALDYARLMAQVRSGDGEAWAWMRSLIERSLPTSGPSAQDTTSQRSSKIDSLGARGPSLQAVADVAGAHPGILTLAGYGRVASTTEERHSPAADSESRVVVFTLHDLPVAVFYQLAQTGIDKGLFLELLLDADRSSRLMDALKRTESEGDRASK